MWDNSKPDRKNDLDLWVECPSGERVGFKNKTSTCGGALDVDRTEDACNPVENIVWKENAPKGRYRILVHNFNMNHTKSIPFRVTVAIDGGEREMFNLTMPAMIERWEEVKEFEYE